MKRLSNLQIHNAIAKKALRIANILEEFLGKPVQSKRKAAPLDSLIATLLSQNTNDRNSHKAWLNLRRTFPTWERVALAPTKRLANVIEVGGLKNQKAKRIKEILKLVKKEAGSYDLSFLKKKSDSEIIEYLTSMNGIGMKTAACVLVFSLGRDVFPVDTHIHRLCNRLGLVKTKNAEETFEEMKPLVPQGNAYPFHINLIRFGRKVCRSNNPLCGSCPLYDECVYSEKEQYAIKSRKRLQSSRKDVDFMILDHVAS